MRRRVPRRRPVDLRVVLGSRAGGPFGPCGAGPMAPTRGPSMADSVLVAVRSKCRKSQGAGLMKKAFPIGLMIVGLAFLIGGGYTAFRGWDAKAQVRDELLAQNIVTTPDASIPNVKVQDAATAQSMADIIQHHMLEATGGQTYAEMDRYLAADGGTTSDDTAALLDDGGNPVPNPLRNVAFQAVSLRTSLYTSVMAFNVSDLVMGLGLMIAVVGLAIGGVGVALGGLAIPSLARKVHVEPIVAETTA